MSTAQSSPPAAAYDPGMRPMHRALPRYIRIAEELQGRIGAGRYEVGGLLPSEPALGREFGVSRTTVRQAIERLHERGLVRPEVGRGTRVLGARPRGAVFALADFNEQILARGQTPATRLLDRRVMTATDEVASRLRLAAGTAVIRLVRLRLADDVPVVYETRFLARDTCPALLAENVERQSVHRLLLDRYGIPPVRVDLSITRLPVALEEAAHLAVPVDTMIFHLDRVTYQAEDQPVTWLRASYRSDHFDLVVHH